jgi:hypothetical protein
MQNIRKNERKVKKRRSRNRQLAGRRASSQTIKSFHFAMEGLSATDLQIFWEKSRAFLGSGKIPLA